MSIFITFDASAYSAPAGFIADVNYVANLYGSIFSNIGNMNIRVGYGTIGGASMGSNQPLGETLPTLSQDANGNILGYSYSTIQQHLTDSQVPGASLPAVDPTGGQYFVLPSEEARAIGLNSISPTFDASVGFSSTAGFD